MAINSLSTGWRPGVCTSSTRPTAPYEGQQIYETDTDLLRIWNGSAWVSNPSTFTTEAARDAAITSPSEGMIAYLTAPTIPAAAGLTTMVPTGIQTIYNGTSWVCITDVGAATATAGTTTATGAFTQTLTSGGTNPSVTLTTGTTAIITVAANLTNSGSVSSYMAVAVSGATTVSGDTFETTWGAARTNANASTTASRTYVISGLTAGTNTFALSYLVAGSTGTYVFRSITARGIA